MPVRIQRKRVPGWRQPPGAIYVGRPTVWGNPFKGPEAVEEYRKWVTALPLARKAVQELRGKDLCCWCPPGQPCHADVLLELANAPD